MAGNAKELAWEDIVERDMEEALKNREFQVYFQPKVNMLTSHIYGAEALSRWVHHDRGLVPPDEFIPVFEKNGFIRQLDLYVFEEVCRYKAEWKGRSYEHIIISVNLSRANLYEKELPETLAGICKKYDVPMGEIEIEITENIFIKDCNELIAFVNKIKECGFGVSIDDFGSGYSSLNMLRNVNTDVVKIDKDFLNLSKDDVRGRRILKYVIGMCKELKLDVVVEGIENWEQIDMILECGCENAQGFYYSKPVDVDEFEEFAEKYSLIMNDSIHFPLKKDISCGNSKYQCSYDGTGFRFEEGPVDGAGSLYFPGGRMTHNTVRIHSDVLIAESYSVMFWAKPEVLSPWSSIFYVKYEGGFFSFSPLAEEGTCAYRIRDSRNVDGWYDNLGKALDAGKWYHIAMVYSAKKEESSLYINGEKAGGQTNVPTIRYPKRIILGGDVFQKSFQGNVSELIIYFNAKSEKEIQDIYQAYLD